jgi:hypothetical protein
MLYIFAVSAPVLTHTVSLQPPHHFADPNRPIAHKTAIIGESSSCLLSPFCSRGSVVSHKVDGREHHASNPQKP